MTELSPNPPMLPPVMEVLDGVDPAYATSVANLDASIWRDPLLARIALSQYQINPGVVGSFLDIWQRGREAPELSAALEDPSSSEDSLVNSFLTIHAVFKFPDTTLSDPAHGYIRFDPETERLTAHSRSHCLASIDWLQTSAVGYSAEELEKEVRHWRSRMLAEQLGTYIDRVAEKKTADTIQNPTD